MFNFLISRILVIKVTLMVIYRAHDIEKRILNPRISIFFSKISVFFNHGFSFENEKRQKNEDITVYFNQKRQFLTFSQNKLVCLFVCNRGDTIQYHGGLRSRELGHAPLLLVFLTPRQALSSHPRQ